MIYQRTANDRSNRTFAGFRTAKRGWLLILPLCLGWIAPAPGQESPSPPSGNKPYRLTLRARAETPAKSGGFQLVYRPQEWDPTQTAVIVCDMWNEHWCRGANRRVGEIAPLMNRVIARARERGSLIIHAPSSCMQPYENHPARKRAQNAPQARNLPPDIDRWCSWLGDFEKKVYPIDQSDGGCDCRPQCKTGSPWRSQIDILEIADQDAISDSGVEIWNLMEQRSIKNVIIMGVHTNMCVLGRPFGLRNMARYGKNVVLMRDLTDTMYNSRSRPFVSHFTGTDLIVEHIEKYVCPTITSSALLGGKPYRFQNDKRPRVVFISAESEYQAAQTLPVFARQLELNCGLACEILQGSTEKNGPGRHNIPGMEALADADLAVVFARRRALPAGQMQYLRDYLARGKPLIGLRTASHAFDARGAGPEGTLDWARFDPEVLGGNYHGHYGSGPVTTAVCPDEVKDHPILKGVSLPLRSNGSLYEAAPLSKTTTLLLNGSIPGQQPEPLAWTNTYGSSRIFYTSLGHPDDFQNPQFRQLLINAIFWALDKPAPDSNQP